MGPSGVSTKKVSGVAVVTTVMLSGHILPRPMGFYPDAFPQLGLGVIIPNDLFFWSVHCLSHYAMLCFASSPCGSGSVVLV
jgi:hypothetical protein